MQDERYKVDDQTQCWIWQRATNASGYGKLRVHGKDWLAHRWFWSEAHGPILDGMVIDHLCRTRRCVNPGHMELVTPGENQRRGARIRMTPTRIVDVRRRYRSGESVRALAAAYGVSRGAIWGVVNGDRWDLGGERVQRDGRRLDTA